MNVTNHILGIANAVTTITQNGRELNLQPVDHK